MNEADALELQRLLIDYYRRSNRSTTLRDAAAAELRALLRVRLPKESEETIQKMVRERVRFAERQEALLQDLSQGLMTESEYYKALSSLSAQMADLYGSILGVDKFEQLFEVSLEHARQFGFVTETELRPPRESAEQNIGEPTDTRATTYEPARRIAQRKGSSSGCSPHFEQLLALTGLREISRRPEASEGWEIWSAKEPRALSGKLHDTVICVLLKPGTADRVTALKRDLLGTTPKARVAVVLGPRLDAKLLDDYRQRLIADFEPRPVDVISFDDLVSDIRARLVPRPAHTVAADPHFIEPLLDSPTEKGCFATPLLEELFARNRDSSRVFVLLGKAGAGKSTLAEEFAKKDDALPRRKGDRPTRLLVSENDWIALERRRIAVTLDAVLKESLRSKGFLYDDLSQLDVLLTSGGISLIFDSFDEVCSRGSARTSPSAPSESPNEILERILYLAEAENSRARILLTARPEFWELVDSRLRHRCTELTLRPFDLHQVDAYLAKRFRTSQRRDEVVAILNQLESPTLRQIPLLLATICNAVETRDPSWTGSIGPTIRVSDPLPGVARIVCERELRKHDLPLTAENQFEFFATLAAELGVALPVDDIRVFGAVEFTLSADDVERFTRHSLLRSLDGGQTYVFADPELLRAILCDRITSWLREVALATPGRRPERKLGTLKKLLARVDVDFPGVIPRAGRTLRTQHLSGENLEQLWAFRNELRRQPQAQSTLFRILVESCPPEADGIRRLAFLPMEKGLWVARDFACTGSLSRLDLTSTRFENVMFRDVEISSCRLSGLSAFDRCSFVTSAVGRDCVGMSPDAFATAVVDDDTASNSNRWIQFRLVKPEGVARVALQRVLYRLLRSAGLLESGSPSAFSLGTPLTEDQTEENVLQTLRSLHIVDARLMIDPRFEGDARRAIKQGEFVGSFGKAYRQVATETAKGWVH